MAIKRMVNVGIGMEDIDAAIEFFAELGLELEGRAQGQMACGVLVRKRRHAVTQREAGPAANQPAGCRRRPTPRGA